MDQSLVPFFVIFVPFCGQPNWTSQEDKWQTVRCFENCEVKAVWLLNTREANELNSKSSTLV
jgi:hypothetical protein